MCVRSVGCVDVAHMVSKRLWIWGKGMDKGMAWARAGDVVASYVAWAWSGVGIGMRVECHELCLQVCTLPCIVCVYIATTPLPSICVFIHDDDQVVL